MVFKCQEDSFLKEFSSKVVSCEKTKEPIIEYGKTSQFEGYQVTLENTILFPAGGGQKEYNLPTTSWWLGADECHVELDALKVADDVITAAEARCNDLIRQGLAVKVKFLKMGDPDLDERVFDENMCCGTHVANLSQLQAIKLLGAEPGKKGKTNLRFVVGNRVTWLLQRMLERERALTALLK
ncbi:hypothetical protein MSG28_004950 [Choristoneura fumiferana]|uniref:Uncharacterized protein n=1 Tax=Choristoneura fumiferana TaxID=7141 RepID=A0ACC0JPB0_CHOFU|nr:hypothetical protein MSG28_004950 [Choristoneura fumiferana]